MNNWENAVVTNKGISLLAKLIAGETLHITRGETGSGYVTPGTLQSQVAVTSPIQQVSFREATYPEEGKCALTCFITNEGLDAAYTANQVGIYATDPDEGEILFFITQATSGKGMDIPAETEMPGYSSEWTFYFQYGQAGAVHVTVDPSNSVSFAEVETHVKAKLGEHTSKKDNPHEVTAEQVGALPSTGGIVSGPVSFKKGNNPGTAKLAKNHSETADYGFVMTDYDKDGKHASVAVRAKDNKAFFIDNNDTYNELYHAGHNPTPRDVGAAREVANYVTSSETNFDLNTATDSLYLIPIAFSKGCPINDTFVYIRQLFYSNTGETANRIQIAYPYSPDALSSGIAIRNCKNNTWGAWKRLATTEDLSISKLGITPASIGAASKNEVETAQSSANAAQSSANAAQSSAAEAMGAVNALKAKTETLKFIFEDDSEETIEVYVK